MTHQPTYTESVVCKVAGTGGIALRPNTLQAWRSRGLLGADQPDQSGRTRYTLSDLLRACVLAELSRLSVTFLHDYKGRATLLLTEVERALRDQMTLEMSTVPEAPAEKARYVFGDWTLTNGEEASSDPSHPRPFETPHSYFTRMADDDQECAAVLVIDTSKLLRRLVLRMRELGEVVSDEERQRWDRLR